MEHILKSPNGRQTKIPFEELKEKIIPEWYPKYVRYSEKYAEYLRKEIITIKSRANNPEFVKAHPNWEKYRKWANPKKEREIHKRLIINNDTTS